MQEKTEKSKQCLVSCNIPKTEKELQDAVTEFRENGGNISTLICSLLKNHFNTDDTTYCETDTDTETAPANIMPTQKRDIINEFLEEVINQAKITHAQYAGLANTQKPVTVFAGLLSQYFEKKTAGEATEQNVRIDEEAIKQQALRIFLQNIAQNAGIEITELYKAAHQEGGLSAYFGQKIARKEADIAQVCSQLLAKMPANQFNKAKTYIDQIGEKQFVIACIEATLEYIDKKPFANTPFYFISKKTK